MNTPSNGKISQDIGRLQGKVEGIEVQLERLQTNVSAIKEAIDQAKGGWKTAVWLAGSGGAVGAGVVKVLAWTSGFPK